MTEGADRREAAGVVAPFTHRPTLVNDAYADPANLSARQRLWSYGQGPSFHERLVELVDWPAIASVLDVGCGNAIYLDRILSRLPPRATVVGVDLSPGMLVAARHPTGRVVGDIESLAVRSAAFDAVLALHMVYHAPHPDRAVAELRRVTRDGGVAVISTNGPRHFAELAVFNHTRTRGSQAFGLDRAEKMLGRVFSRVERHDLINELVVSDPEPVISYLRSTISLGADPAALADADRLVRQEISRHGSFRITAAPGALICR